METTLHRIPVGRLLNGYQLSLTVHEFVGDSPGPSLGLCATIHGDEDISIEIFRQFALELKQLRFRGRIYMLPVANPLALGTFSRNTPIDMLNLNAVFPGSEKGTLSEQIAAAITKEYLSKIDCLVDFHSGGAFPTCEYTLIDALGDVEEATKLRSLELGRMFGQKFLYFGGHEHTVEYYLSQRSTPRNVPAIVVEVGGGGKRNHYYFQEGLKGIRNVMKYVKMIDGDPILPAQQYLVKDFIFVRPRNGGIYRPSFGLEGMHSVYAKNTLLGSIYCPYTFEELERFYGPFDQNVILLLRPDVCKIEPGDYLFILANMTTAEALH